MTLQHVTLNPWKNDAFFRYFLAWYVDILFKKTYKRIDVLLGSLTWASNAWHRHNVMLHVHICSGRNRIIPLMRRPNTDSTPNRSVTLPRNQLLIRYRVTNFWYVTRARVLSTLPRYGVTICGNVTSVYPLLQAFVKGKSGGAPVISMKA